MELRRWVFAQLEGISLVLIETTDPDSNWKEVLRLWDEICWTRTPSEEVQRKSRDLLIALWNEKDWLKSEYPNRANDIEDFVNNSKHLSVVADLANTLKHRELKNRRSTAREVEDVWNRTLTGFRNRQIGMIQVSDSEYVAVSALLGYSIAAYKELR